MFSGAGAAKYLIDTPNFNMKWRDSLVMEDLGKPEESKAFTPYFGLNGQAAFTTSVPVYPPQPYHTQATTRTLHVTSNKWIGWHVLDTDNVTELFRFQSKLRKPHLRITSSATGDIVGTAVLPSLSGCIDATVRGAQTSIVPCGTFGRKGHVYASPALHGANVTWNTIGHNLDLVCWDEQGIVIARFRFNHWSLQKCGKLELVGPVANDGGALMEEVIVTGLAMASCVLEVL